MNCGNDSNWFHWLYAVETGTSISIDSSIVFICSSIVWCFLHREPNDSARVGGPPLTPVIRAGRRANPFAILT